MSKQFPFTIMLEAFHALIKPKRFEAFHALIEPKRFDLSLTLLSSQLVHLAEANTRQEKTANSPLNGSAGRYIHNGGHISDGCHLSQLKSAASIGTKVIQKVKGILEESIWNRKSCSQWAGKSRNKIWLSY